jgi:hypothetical protein
MENQCPKCGSDLKILPAGISKKTGKPYRAFTACTKWECDYTAKGTSEAQNAPVRPFKPQSAHLPIQPNTEALEAKIEALRAELVQEINNLKMAQHATWATLIMGDKGKETQYEFAKIPIIKPKPVEPEPEPEQLSVPY